ncbi:hypothetical protein Bca4012_009944 [Brassica carinata]
MVSMFYMLHIAFCVFSAVAPPVVFKGKSLAIFEQGGDGKATSNTADRSFNFLHCVTRSLLTKTAYWR